ncbi:hypothetical protein P7C73_g5990, partial [Tremellales sp. Uapishka_1]
MPGEPLEVVPGRSLGIFRLGDTLWQILDLLRTHRTDYPKLDISWDPDNPHKSAVTIHLPHITLLFPSSLRQRLELIRIPDIPELVYQTQVLSSSNQRLTRARVGRILGPTFEGKDNGKLDYPGIAFDLGGSGRDDLVEAITITPKDDGSGDDGYSVVVKPNQGVTIQLPDPLDIVIHQTTAQDLLLDLGPPLRKFWKEDDRLQKMWGGEAVHGGCKADSELNPLGCTLSFGIGFWNYFQYGMDFLIVDGKVKKVLLHSNIPGTPLFQRYARCPWTLPSSSGSLDYTSPLSAFRSNLTSKVAYDEIQLALPPMPVVVSGKKSKKRTPSPNDVDTAPPTPETPLDAMILDRVVEGGLEGVVGMGCSKLIAFEGIILEVDEKSGGICSLLIWKEEE